MVKTPSQAPLPGMELTPDVMLSTEAARIQAARRRAGDELAQYLMDGTADLVEVDGQLVLMDTATGELFEDRAAAFGALLSWASEDSNHAAGILEGCEGQPYYGSLSLWKSSLRLDPNWMEAMRRRSRATARQAVRRMMDGLTDRERLARRYGWHQRLTLKLLTLTMPHHAGTTSVQEVRRLNRAMELLKKRRYWKRNVAGGVKGVEDALDADGPHVHAHLMILAHHLNREALREEWRECLDQATREAYGFGLAEDCSPFLDVRAVRRKGRASSDTVSMDEALEEVTKYVTKPASYLQPDEHGRRIPREVLLEICEVRLWPRMFELLGRARKRTKARKVRLDPKDITAAAAAALDSIRRAYSTRTLPKLPPEVGWELVEAWDPETDGPEEKRKLVIAALKARERDGPKRPRPPSWRELLDVLPLSEWLRMMRGRVARGRRFRLRQILDANPSAYLVTFDGRSYGLETAFAGV